MMRVGSYGRLQLIGATAIEQPQILAEASGSYGQRETFRYSLMFRVFLFFSNSDGIQTDVRKVSELPSPTV